MTFKLVGPESQSHWQTFIKGKDKMSCLWNNNEWKLSHMSTIRRASGRDGENVVVRDEQTLFSSPWMALPRKSMWRISSPIGKRLTSRIPVCLIWLFCFSESSASWLHPWLPNSQLTFHDKFLKGNSRMVTRIGKRQDRSVGLVQQSLFWSTKHLSNAHSPGAVRHYHFANFWRTPTHMLCSIRTTCFINLKAFLFKPPRFVWQVLQRIVQKVKPRGQPCRSSNYRSTTLRAPGSEWLRSRVCYRAAMVLSEPFWRARS